MCEALLIQILYFNLKYESLLRIDYCDERQFEEYSFISQIIGMIWTHYTSLETLESFYIFRNIIGQ